MDKPPEQIVELAIAIANSSPCQKSKRGVVAYNANLLSNPPIRIGTNGPAIGRCDGSETCRQQCNKICIHAEQAALLQGNCKDLDMLHVKTVDNQLVPSGPPSCVECSKLVLAAGIKGFWLYHEEGWRKYIAVEFHRLSLRYHGLKE